MRFSEAVEQMMKDKKVVCDGYRGYYDMTEGGKFKSSNIVYHEMYQDDDSYIFLSKSMLQDDCWHVLEDCPLTWEQALKCMYDGEIVVDLLGTRYMIKNNVLFESDNYGLDSSINRCAESFYKLSKMKYRVIL